MEAPSTDLLAFFSQVRAEGGIVVEGSSCPSPAVESGHDIDSLQSCRSSTSNRTSQTMKVRMYVSSRKPPLTCRGRTRFDRLLHIGRTSIPLSLDALKAAIAEAKAGSDVTRYLDAWDNIRKAAPGDPDAVRDEDWIRSKGEANKKETARLEAELRRYRNNLIKESIRMGYEDLGHHLEETGLLKEALEIYGKMRQEVSSTKHIMDCSQRLIGVNLQRREWTNVLTNVGKIAAISGVDEDRGMQPYVKIIYGVGYLGLGKFAEAARYFPQTDSTAPAHTYNDIVTPNDVAIYGGLTALATLERRALQARILDNAFFRVFLEHEPHIRKAITHFVNGRYSNCLTILAEHEADYLMDIYLARHVKELFGLIRRKCIVQYFIPFSCVTLQSLDEVFASNGQSIEKELVGMIRDGSLNARIDAKSKVGCYGTHKTITY